MAAEILTADMSVKVPLPQLWEAFKDLHKLMPRLLPGFIESSRLEGGPIGGGVGSVRHSKYSSEVPGISWTKEFIEKVDGEKHIFVYEMVDGDLLESYSSFRGTWRFQPHHLESSRTEVHWTAEIVPLPTPTSETDAAVTVRTAEDDRRKELYRESAQLLMKQLEAHLIVTGEYSQPSPKERLREDLLSS